MNRVCLGFCKQESGNYAVLFLVCLESFSIICLYHKEILVMALYKCCDKLSVFL